MGMAGGTKVSIVLCDSPWRGKHQVTTTKWSLWSTVYMETRNDNNQRVLQWIPVDAFGRMLGRRNRLPGSFPYFYPNRLWYPEMLKLSTFLCKCFYPGRQYVTYQEAFWAHSSEAAEAGRFAGNTTMGMPPVITLFLSPLSTVIFHIVQSIELGSVPVSAKIMQLQ